MHPSQYLPPPTGTALIQYVGPVHLEHAVQLSPQPNGNLKMTADILTRDYIHDLRQRASSEIAAEGRSSWKYWGRWGLSKLPPKT